MLNLFARLFLTCVLLLAVAACQPEPAIFGPDGENVGQNGDGHMSADGRYIAFYGYTGVGQVYLTDMVEHTTVLVSRSPNGTPGNGASGDIHLSANGRFIAFTSRALNLGDTDGSGPKLRGYVADLEAGSLEVVSRGLDGSDKAAAAIEISGDGRKIAMLASPALNDPSRFMGVHVVDRESREITTLDTGDLAEFSTLVMSQNGRYLAYLGYSDETDGELRVHDLLTGEHTSHRDKVYFPLAFSPDGRYLALWGGPRDESILLRDHADGSVTPIARTRLPGTSISHDGVMLFAHSDPTLWYDYNIEKRRLKTFNPFIGPITSGYTFLRISAHGDFVAQSNSSNLIRRPSLGRAPLTITQASVDSVANRLSMTGNFNPAPWAPSAVSGLTLTVSAINPDSAEIMEPPLVAVPIPPLTCTNANACRADLGNGGGWVELERDPATGRWEVAMELPFIATQGSMPLRIEACFGSWPSCVSGSAEFQDVAAP